MAVQPIEEHIHHGLLAEADEFFVVDVRFLRLHRQVPLEAVVLDRLCVDLEVSLQRLDIRHIVVHLKDRLNVGEAQLEQEFA